MHGHAERSGFRWRSSEITRIEGFSDAVFGFAVTLLIISLEVPRTFTELAEVMQDLPAFVLSFSLLFYLWYSQHRFFRRYGLQDALTVVLNGALLLVVLIYIYPLKFLCAFLVNLATDGHGVTRLRSGESANMLQRNEAGHMMAMYSAGYVAIFTVFFLLYLRAWRKRDALQLSASEKLLTRDSLCEYAINIAVGLLSLAVIWNGGAPAASTAGTVYLLLPVAQTANGFIQRRLRHRAEAKAAA